MISVTTILKLQFSANGEPYCPICLSTALKPNYLRLSQDGSPFWGHSGGSVEIITTGNVKRILKVDWPYVKTIINVEG